MLHVEHKHTRVASPVCTHRASTQGFVHVPEKASGGLGARHRDSKRKGARSPPLGAP